MVEKDGYTRSLGIDKKDLVIMYELNLDCRQSNAEIGRKVHLDKSVVGYRIDKLIKNGFITEFYTVIDHMAIGHQGYRVYLKWQFTSKERENEIIEHLKSKKSTWWIGEISGYWNLGFVIWAKDFMEFEEFWSEFLNRYQGFIAKKALALYCRVYDCNYSFLNPDNTSQRYAILSGRGQESLSKTEELVLDVITNNSRMPTIKISEKTGMSVATVKQRLKSLQKRGIIKGFRARIDEKKLGYSLYKINCYLNDMSRQSGMLEFCLSNPNVFYIPLSIGFAEFEVELAARNNTEVEDFINSFLREYAESIRGCDYFVFTKLHKVRYW
jgi:DNA-binding Lrp family transcriptional regulator